MNLISVSNGDSFICIENKDNTKKHIINAPVFEVDKKAVGGNSLLLMGQKECKSLRNGGNELTFDYTFNNDNNLKLKLILRYFPNSPFIRYKYVLSSSEKRVLTKNKCKDNILYTGFKESGLNKLTEIQFSQFESIAHSFMPNFEQRDENELSEGVECPGPIILLEDNDFSSLMAYEHGAEYPDTYLMFDAIKKDNTLNLNIRAFKGNYYNGQIIDSKHPFESPWFHFALCEGSKNELLKYYREFFLKYISENTESRKPYIYYNTWNYQERNRYYRNLPYLYSMNQDRIMKEIDIAHQMGVDVFVIDTGWFDKTGDWLVNTNEFPDGLKSVKEKLNRYHMKLGLWFNPIVAAKTSEIYKAHPEYVISKDGVANFWGRIWETEESYGMCLASDYTEYFIKKLINLNKELGVTYFKWDAISQYGCNSPLHNHGTSDNPADERLECYSYQMGMKMIKIVEEVTKACPDAIIDFDITEGGRFVGLGFLSVGKYFLMNNGPYFSDFDIPSNFEIKPNTINVFFHPGAARPKVCRQGTKYDSFVPSILFLTHFLPDGPKMAQMNSLCALMLGGNGIWGDLLSLSEEDIALFSNILKKYKKVADSVTKSYPRIKGFIGSSPEIHEKIDYDESKGMICFFTRAGGTYTHITDKINKDKFYTVEGADSFYLTDDGRLKITVKLENNEARPVFVFSKDDFSVSIKDGTENQKTK